MLGQTLWDKLVNLSTKISTKLKICTKRKEKALKTQCFQGLTLGAPRQSKSETFSVFSVAFFTSSKFAITVPSL